MRPKLTFANVISCLALFVALGGIAVAAGLPKNSVGTKQLKKSSVTAIKIKDGAVSAAKLQDHSITGSKIADGSLTGTQVNASTLGTVPVAERANRANSADRADVAGRAESLPPSEPWHVVGTAGEPPLLNGWVDADPESSLDAIAFYKDHEGVVHLKGRAFAGTATLMFNLPPGFRPPENKTIFPVVACECPSSSFGVINISGTVPTEAFNSGAVYVPSGATSIALDGVTFRAES